MAKKKAVVRWSDTFTNEEILAGLQVFVTRVEHGSIVDEGFRMSTACNTNSEAPCGSTACIGGHVGLILGLSHHKSDRFVTGLDYRHGLSRYANNNPLTRLFFPQPSSNPRWTHNVKQAANVVKKFIRTHA